MGVVERRKKMTKDTFIPIDCQCILWHGIYKCVEFVIDNGRITGGMKKLLYSNIGSYLCLGTCQPHLHSSEGLWTLQQTAKK